MPLSAAARRARDGHKLDFVLLPVLGDRGVHVNLALLRTKWPWLDSYFSERWHPSRLSAGRLRLEGLADWRQVHAVVEGVLTGDWPAAIRPVLSATPSHELVGFAYGIGAIGLDAGIGACEATVLAAITGRPPLAVQWTPRVTPLGFSERFHRKIRECVQEAFPGTLCRTEEWIALCKEDAAFWLATNAFPSQDEGNFLIALAWWGWGKNPRDEEVRLLLQQPSCFRSAEYDETLFPTSHPMHAMLRDERARRREHRVVEVRPRPWLLEFSLTPIGELVDWSGRCGAPYFITTDDRVTIGGLKNYIISRFQKTGEAEIASIVVFANGVGQPQPQPQPQPLADDSSLVEIGRPEAVTYSYVRRQ